MKKHFSYLLCIILLLFSAVVHAQSLKITGTVVDPNNDPIIGASVRVKGDTQGTITDIDGKFTLNASPDKSLEISYIGYVSQTITLNGKSDVLVILKEDSKMLDDVVVIGYGVAKKSDITSSINSVKGKDLTDISSGNALNALQGKANGVQITSTGGGPGTVPRIIIRGVSTVNGTDPLYVVDGVPLSTGSNINFINPSDIESMEVLKDASASAIYGTRAANGVIIITTKRGQKGATTFDFSASVGMQHINKVRVANAQTYKNFVFESYMNDGYSESSVPWNSASDTYMAAHGGTDWWKETINDWAVTHNYTLGFQGGGDKVTFSGSLGYFEQDSQYDVGYWRRITGRFNMEYTFTDQIKFGVDFNPKYETWADTPNQLGAILAMDPTTPVFKSESEWESNKYNNYQRSYNNQTWNPAAAIARQNSNSKEFGFLTNPYLQITPIKDLTVRSQLGLNLRFRMADEFTPEFYLDNLEQNTSATAKRTSNDWLDWSWTNTANYMKSFGKHNFNVMGGFSMEKFSRYFVSAGQGGIPNNDSSLQYPAAGTKDKTVDGYDERVSYLSFLGRLMYNYDNRYYLTATIRRDGSSKFPSGNKYATFPSASVAWRLSEESFMKDQNVISNAKIRLGWGRVGNSNIDSGAYDSYVGSADYVFGGDRYVGTAVSQIANRTLKWETVEDYNVGLDLAFLNNRLDVTAEWFNKESKDMLMKRANLLVSGYPMWNAEMWSNIGKMQARGWELAINWRDNVQKVNYEVGVNLSSIKNKALKFSTDSEIYKGSFYGDYAIKNIEGAEISRFYLYQFDGIFQNQEEINAHASENGSLLQPNAKPGDMRFKDVNNDGVIDENDKVWSGSAFPDLTMGFNFRVSYENWDLSSNFYGSFGNKIYNSAKAGLYSGSNKQNVLADAYDKAWRGEGSTNDYPRLSAADPNKNYSTVSTFFLESGSYFRCKQIQLGYTLPKDWTKNAKIRLSLSAQNLFTITPYSGMDPERASSGDVLQSGFDELGYPAPRTFLFGLNVNF